MPSGLRRSILALTVAVVAVPAPDVFGQLGQCSIARPKMRADRWTEIAVPEASIGEPAITDFAAPAFAPVDKRPLFVTNGRTVQRSLDAGCGWEEVFVPTTAIGEIPVPGPEIVIDAIEVAPSPRATWRVYLLLHDETRAYVAVSEDLGDTWNAASVGLPPQATGIALKVTPNPLVAYALLAADGVEEQTLLQNGRVGLGRLYVTRDGGEQWRPVNLDVAPEQLDDMALDAADPRALYVWNSRSMWASTDSGATFRRVNAVQPPISTVDVYRFPPATPARVLAFRANQRAAYRSTDGGATWGTVPMPGVVKSAAHAFTTDVYATAGDRGVHVSGVGFRVPADITPKGLPVPVNLQFVERNQLYPTRLYGQAGNRLYARDFTIEVRPEPPSDLPPVNLRGGVIPDIDASSLTPPSTTLAMLPGQSRTVRYQLDLAPTPTPLDVFFATDSTGSMSGVIGGMRESFQDIINALGASGIDVRFGIADFRDYPIPGFGGPDDYPYRMLRGIGEIDEELKDAIESLEDGGGMNLDSQLAAAYQMATGEGQEIAPGSSAGGRTGRWIEPTKPNWRPNSLKVIVLAADVRAHAPEHDPGYPGPSYPTVIRTLNRRGIEFVGLAVGEDSDLNGGPYESLSRVAKGTRTLAPEGGTDCNGDGKVDVRAGQPMVCRLLAGNAAASGVAPAIINLLTSVTDLNTVGVEIVGDGRVVKHSSLPAYDEINVKVANRLFFDVTYACSAETAGETYAVTLRARSGERAVAAATASVTCIMPPEGPKPVFAGSPPVTTAAGILPPPPPPAPVPQTNPQTNPNPNPQTQPAPQGQPGYGMAAEEQEQAELAFVYEEITADTELAMSRLPSESDDYLPALLLAGLAMTGAAGAVATRSRGVPRVVLNTFKK